MTLSLPGISVITLGVINLTRAVDFYQKGLGLVRAKRPSDVVYFKLRGSWLALYPYEKLAHYAGVTASKAADFSGVTLSCNVSDKNSVDVLIQQAMREGASLVNPAKEMSWGGYAGWLSDPEGYLWEIIWNPHWPD